MHQRRGPWIHPALHRQTQRHWQGADPGVAGPRYHTVCRLQGSPWGLRCFRGQGRNALDPAVSVDLQALVAQQSTEREYAHCDVGFEGGFEIAKLLSHGRHEILDGR